MTKPSRRALPTPLLLALLAALSAGCSLGLSVVGGPDAGVRDRLPTTSAAVRTCGSSRYTAVTRAIRLSCLRFFPGAIGSRCAGCVAAASAAILRVASRSAWGTMVMPLPSQVITSVAADETVSFATTGRWA
ncbi:MAG: hypothetical protein Q8S73_16620 [Deltaproteobacteria bacterium]|nr:hypothetical protein [Deltaproteobacteria bacterium]